MQLNIGHMLEVFRPNTQVQPTISPLSGNTLTQFRFSNPFTYGTNKFQNFSVPSAVRSTTAGRNNKVLARQQFSATAADQGLVFDNGRYTFLPFSFGGAVASLTGDNVDATLEIGNTRIARDFVTRYIETGYVAKVRTVLWSSELKVPLAPGTIYVEKTLSEYVGYISAGGWDESKLQIKLNSVLDAVEANVPGRRLRRNQVGNVPFSGQVSF